MFCKKCGTEQKDGQKYCPKCGEPFLDENGKPYLKGIRKDLQDAKDKLASKADELTQQGKKLVEEKVQPQLNELTEKGKNLVEEKVQPKLNEKIDELKKVDWEERKTESVKSMQSFFSNTDKLRTATIWIAIIAVLWFFIINHGFSASWIWWGLAIIVVGGAFYKAKSLNDTRKMFAAILFLGLCLVFYSPSSSGSMSGISDDVDIEASSDKDMEILTKMSQIRGEIKSILPTVDALYQAHQQHLARGFQYASSPAWGKWQDCNKRIDDLWNEYIRLAQQLDDNDDIIEEARESKRKMDKAFMDMFGQHF